ncbi:MAG: phosphoribosyl-ATP diphosphatase [Pseudomonadota bacterium]
MTEEQLTGATLDALYQVIDQRRDGDPNTSYTAKLFAKGPAWVAQRTGEEAIETVVAACTQSSKELAEESADLLYHLLALWAACGLEPEAVWRALDARRGTSGHQEESGRKKGQWEGRSI